MTRAITITKQGLAECISAKNNGIKVEIGEISVGDRSYIPSPNQKQLQNEKARVPISQYVKTGDTSLQCVALLSDDDEYPIGEIAIWLTSGTLLGVISDPHEVLNFKSAKGSVLIPFTMDFSALPTDSVEVVVGVENLNILIDTEVMMQTVAFVGSQTVQIKQAHMQMQLSERLRLMEAG